LVGITLDDETGEAGVHVQSLDGKAGLAQRALDQRRTGEPVNSSDPRLRRTN
jgi:hypothetical protein